MIDLVVEGVPVGVLEGVGVLVGVPVPVLVRVAVGVGVFDSVVEQTIL